MPAMKRPSSADVVGAAKRPAAAKRPDAQAKVFLPTRLAPVPLRGHQPLRDGVELNQNSTVQELQRRA